MHKIYHTEGFVLGSRNFGESNKSVHIFTKEFGLIRASVQGLRKLDSKLHCILQDFSYVNVDLVQGKDSWRITSASSAEDFMGLIRNPRTLSAVAGMFRLLKRLLAGEEKNEDLFFDLYWGISMLNMQSSGENDSLIKNLEAVLVLRILHRLGYASDNEELSPLIYLPIEDMLSSAQSIHRPLVLSEINKSLKESHL